MTREQRDLLSAPLVRTVNDMEDEILRVIAAQLSKDGNISDTSKWRIRQLARSGEMDKETAKIIAKYSGLEESFAMAAIEDAAKIEMGYVDNAVRAEGLAALAMGGEASAEASAMGAYTAFQRQAKSSLNLVNTVMMYKAKQTFVNGVNKIYFESEKSRQNALNTMGKYSAGTVMGQFSLQEATRRCIKEMAGKGIPAFVDKRGREWSPEAYVMMDMRSTLGNTARAAQWARCDEYGIKLVEVSSHLGARPGCAPYQGRIFSRDGSSGTTTDGAGNKITYTPLSQTSYGKPDGLFGINCGHVQYPFFPGCSFQSYFPYPKEENAEMYKNHQKQRYYERQIRAAKRECVMLNETGDKEGFNQAAARLKRSKESYKKFTESKGLYLHSDRTQVVGFDRSVSSKATWANRKAEQAKASAAAVKAGGVPTGGKGSSSGGHAVTVNAPKPDVVGNTNVIYKDTKTGLTSEQERDIINVTTKLNQNGVFEPNPMDSNRYNVIKSGLEKRGCTVTAAKSGSDDERYLKYFNAEAISDEHGIIHLGEIPSASAFFEEIIHYSQMQKYGVVESSDFVERAAREVAANRKLLKHSRAYGFNADDFKDIENNLTAWERDFETRVGVPYDKADIKREI